MKRNTIYEPINIIADAEKGISKATEIVNPPNMASRFRAPVIGITQANEGESLRARVGLNTKKEVTRSTPINFIPIIIWRVIIRRRNKLLFP